MVIEGRVGRFLIVFGLFALLLILSCNSGTRVPAPDSINIAVPYEIDTLDPQAKTRLSNFSIAFNFYDPLVRTDEEMKIMPATDVRDCLHQGRRCHRQDPESFAVPL